MNRLTLRTPSRLHFGLLAWGPRAPRQFGGVGLMIDRPGLELVATPAPAWAGRGPAGRAGRSTSPPGSRRPWRGRASRPRPARPRDPSGPPEHVGLGVGTQLSLAVARSCSAGSRACPIPPPPLADLTGRGLRSGIGLHGFALGGLIVDGGRRTPRGSPPCSPAWSSPATGGPGRRAPAGGRPARRPGEVQAFAELPADLRRRDRPALPARPARPAPGRRRARPRRLRRGPDELQQQVGRGFAPAQGGTFARPELATIVAYLRAEGLRGVGQSSWGPTLYGFGDSVPADRRAEILARLRDRFGLDDREAFWTRASPRGAEVVADAAGPAPCLIGPIGSVKADPDIRTVSPFSDRDNSLPSRVVRATSGPGMGTMARSGRRGMTREPALAVRRRAGLARVPPFDRGPFRVRRAPGARRGVPQRGPRPGRAVRGTEGPADPVGGLLARLGLADAATRDPAGTARAWKTTSSPGPSPAGPWPWPSCRTDPGCGRETRTPRLAMAWYRDAAALASIEMSDPVGVRPDLALALHNRALARLIRIAQDEAQRGPARLAGRDGRAGDRPGQHRPLSRPRPVRRPPGGRRHPRDRPGQPLPDRWPRRPPGRAPGRRPERFARPARPVPPPPPPDPRDGGARGPGGLAGYEWRKNPATLALFDPFSDRRAPDRGPRCPVRRRPFHPAGRSSSPPATSRTWSSPVCSSPTSAARGARRGCTCPAPRPGQDPGRPGPRPLLQPPGLHPDDQRARQRPDAHVPVPVLGLPLSHRPADPQLGGDPPRLPGRRPAIASTPPTPTPPSTGWSWSATAWAGSSPR